MKDYKIWLGGFMYLGLIVPAYELRLFCSDDTSTLSIQSYRDAAVLKSRLGFVPLEFLSWLHLFRTT